MLKLASGGNASPTQRWQGPSRAQQPPKRSLCRVALPLFSWNKEQEKRSENKSSLETGMTSPASPVSPRLPGPGWGLRRLTQRLETPLLSGTLSVSGKLALGGLGSALSGLPGSHLPCHHSPRGSTAHRSGTVAQGSHGPVLGTVSWVTWSLSRL